VAAGAIGVLLELAGVRSAVVSVLVLVFIVVAPTAAIAGLLRGFDVFARIILAAVTAAAGITLIAMIMLAIGAWSVKGGLVAIAIISAACLLAQRGRPARLWSSPGMKRLRGNLMPGRISELSDWLAARMAGLAARWRPGRGPGNGTARPGMCYASGAGHAGTGGFCGGHAAAAARFLIGHLARTPGRFRSYADITLSPGNTGRPGGLRQPHDFLRRLPQNVPHLTDPGCPPARHAGKSTTPEAQPIGLRT